MQEIRAPYSFLKDTIRVLIVESDGALIETCRKFFGICCFFDVQTVRSASEAEKALKSRRRVHVCLNGLDVLGPGGDEYYLLRTYAKKTSFVMVTGNNDAQVGYMAGTLGARGMLRNPRDISLHNLLTTVIQAFMYDIINPDVGGDAPFLRRSTVVLIRDCPESVSRWSRTLEVTDSYLRRAWSGALGIKPKHALFLQHLYRDALAYYEKVCLAGDGGTTALLERPEYAHHHEYWLSNQAVLKEVLHRKG